jgi:hypothetical protein
MVFLRLPGGGTTAIPLSACVANKQSQLDELLMRAGLVSASAQMPVKAIAAALRNFAAATNTRVLDSEGFQSVELAGVSHRVLVKGGVCHWLDTTPDQAAVVLEGKAAKSARRVGSHRKFSKAFQKVLWRQPRLLVVLLFALAAELAYEFDIVLIALLLVGPSSIGKSIIQRSVSLLVNGDDCLRQMNATPQGLIEFLQAQGAAAVYLEDAHGAKVWETLCEAIMAAGNGAEGRLRSSHSRQPSNEAPIRGTLIMSAEASLAETARSGRGTQRSGFYARLLEIYPGEHGMFDDPCDYDNAAALACWIHAQSQEFAGVVGQAFFDMVASDWGKLREQWLQKRDIVRSAILQHAGLNEVDGVTHRLTEALTFVGYVGAVAATREVLPVKRTRVFKALGLLLREQVERLSGARTPVALEVVEAVRLFVQTNPGKFLPIEQAGDAISVNGLVGYVKRTKEGTLYLFFPGFFKERFVSKFGSEAYQHLRSAGVLRTHEKRTNRYQARVRLNGQADSAKVLTFVAISDSILFTDS